MPVYTYQGEKWNIPEDKVEDFLNDIPDASLYDELSLVRAGAVGGGNYSDHNPHIDNFLSEKEKTANEEYAAQNPKTGTSFDNIQPGISVGKRKPAGFLDSPKAESIRDINRDEDVIKYQSDHPTNAAQGQSGFWKTGLGDALEKLGAGSIRTGAGLLRLFERLNASTNIPFSEGGDYIPESMMSAISEGSYVPTDLNLGGQLMEKASEIGERGDRYGVMRDPETGEVRKVQYSDLFKKGDILGGLGEIMLTATESAPTSALAMAPGGLALVSLSATGQKYYELENNPSTKDMPEWKKMLNASVSGSLEGLTEKLGAKVDLKMIEPFLKKMTEGTVKQILKKGGIHALIQTITEGAEEVVSQLGENAIDAATGVTDTYKPLEGVLDAFVYGAGGGAQFGGATSAMAGYRAAQFARGRRLSSNRLNDYEPEMAKYFDNWGNLKEQLRNIPVEQRIQAIEDVQNRTDITIPAKKAFSEYTGILNYRDALLGTEKQRTDENRELAEQNGRELVIDDRRKVLLSTLNREKLELESKLGELANMTEDQFGDFVEYYQLTEEQINDWSTYNQRRNEYNGLVKQLKEEIDKEINPAIQDIKRVTRPDGNVIYADFGSEGFLPVINGNIVINEDGDIDRQSSDISLTVLMPDGKKRIISSKFINGNPTVNTPAELEEDVRQQAYDAFVTPIEEAMNGVERFSEGTPVEYVDEKGQTQAGTVVATQGDTVTVMPIDGNKSKIKTFTNKQLRSTLLNETLGDLNVRDEFPVDIPEGYKNIRPGQYKVRVDEIKDGTAVLGFVAPDETDQYIIEATLEDINALKPATTQIEPYPQAMPGVEELAPMDNNNTSDLVPENEGLPMNRQIVSQPNAAFQQLNDISSENQAPGNAAAIPYFDQIPKGEKGTLMFEQAPVETTVGALGEVYEDADELTEVVKATITTIQKQIGKETAPKPTGDISKDIANKQASKQKLVDLNSKLEYWKSVQTAITPEKSTYEQRMEIIEQGNTRERESKMGEYLSLRDYLLRNIATGKYKFLWNNTEGRKGLAGEILASKNTEPERRKRIAFLNNKGYTPESLAEEIYENAGQGSEINPGWFNDMQDIRNEIIDILLSNDTPTSMIDAATELRRQPESLEEYYEEFIDPAVIFEYEANEASQNEMLRSLSVEDDSRYDISEQEYKEYFVNQISEKEFENFLNNSNFEQKEHENNSNYRAGIEDNQSNAIQNTRTEEATNDTGRDSRSIGNEETQRNDNGSYGGKTGKPGERSAPDSTQQSIAERTGEVTGRSVEGSQGGSTENASSPGRKDTDTQGQKQDNIKQNNNERKQDDETERESGIPESIPQGEDAESDAVASRMEEKPADNRREISATSQARQVIEGVGGKQEQLNSLEVWAKDKGFWFDDINQFGIELARGGENEVYASNDDKVIKLNNFEYAGDDAVNLFDRLDAHNTLFPEIPYTVIGFANNSEGEISVVMEQPFILAADRLATTEEIAEYMRGIGFEQVDEDTYRNNDYEVFDAYPNNVLLGADGLLYPIDTQIGKNAQNQTAQEKIEKTASEIDTNPTEAQKEAGNYKKGHVTVQGFDITIENPKGSVRSGVDENGKQWSIEMQNHYGYFKRTEGKDGDQIDVFIGPNPESQKVFVVDQVNPETKDFDESKVMLGFNSAEEAKAAYLSNYEEGWQGLGAITESNVEDFKKWLYDGAKQRKPYSEYKSVKQSDMGIPASDKTADSYGSSNALISTEKYEELRRRMRDKLNNLNVGFDPELFTIGTQMAAYHIEAGARKFADFAKRMIGDLGENVRPYLKSFYESARHMPGMENIAPQMDTPSVVKSTNINELETKATKKTEKKSDATKQLSIFEEDNNNDNNNNSHARVLQANSKRLPERKLSPPVQGIHERGTGRNGDLEGRELSRTDETKQQSDDGQRSILSGHANVSIDQQPALVEFNAECNDQESFNKSRKYADNISAIETLLTLLEENRKATPEEKTILSKYVGFGGLKEILQDPENDSTWKDGKYRDQVRRIVELSRRFDEITNSDDTLSKIRGSILNAHFTPKTVIEAIYKGLNKLGFKSGNILEPSAGIGNFISYMPEGIKGKSNISAVELDKLTGNILKAIHDGAHVQISGIENATIPNNSQDLIISNVPFGNYKVYDRAFKGDREQFLNRIHNYFFAKALDKAREGGIIAFVTSKGVLDSPGNENLREYLSKNADFLGAVRLPNNAFVNTANTQVVTDIIFLRKNSNATGNANFVKVAEIDATHKDGETEKVTVNQCFIDNPQNMLGDIEAGGLYGRSDYTLNDNGTAKNIANIIKEALPANIYQKSRSAMGLQANDLTGKIETVKEGNILLSDGQLYRKEEGVPVAIKLNEPIEKIQEYINLRDALMELIYSEYANFKSETVKANREKLNREYDNFRKAYGKLEKSISRIVKLDADGYNVLALENEGQKADILTKRTINPVSTKSRAESIDEAIIISLSETAGVDMERIGQLTGMTFDEVKTASKGKIFERPEGGHVTRDEYLSGNVKRKLAEAKQAVESGYTEFQNNVDELERVIPADIPAIQIESRLGSRWIPASVYSDFAKHLLNDNGIKISYSPGADQYFSSDSRLATVEATQKYGSSRVNGVDILLSALHINPPKVYDYSKDQFGNQHRELNKVETDKAVQKYQDVRDLFEDWVYKSSNRRELLSKTYNSKFNTSVRRKYDGAHLNIPGISGVELRPHQKDAIWMLLQNNGGVIDHLVGAGKTYVMVAGTMEMKRTGIAKKPMIIALKSTIPQIVETYRAAYPMAKILAPMEKDFVKENRRKLFSKIANNEWDIIIMSHENYGKIPHETDIQEKLINKELSELEAERAEFDNNNDRAALKGLEIRIKNLNARLEKLSDIDKDNSLTFEQMGIDHIMVDESQQFKNLSYITKQRGIAGLGNAEGSKRAFNLLTGVRYLQDKLNGDKGVTFLSGTPITNSIVEMYSLLNYLRPGKMEELGFSSFDSWATTFANPTTDIEFTVTGNFKQKTRFREFMNVPELSMLYTEIADIRTDDNLKLDKPHMKGNGYTVVEVQMNGDQKEFAERLMKFAETKDGKLIGRGELSDNEKSAAMLLATNLSSKMAIDMRLISASYPYDPNGKIAKLVNNVVEYFNKTKQHKGTQLIFSDLGTPKNAGNKSALLRDYLEDEAGLDIDSLNQIFGDVMADNYRYPSITAVREKMIDVIELTNEEADQIIADAENSASKFDIYNETKRRLIEKGIPADQIVFIHDYNTARLKDALFKKVNAGQIRIILGSTQKLGTGVNVQNRVVAVHHIDVPWTPASMEQRNGRALRQGNSVAKEHMNDELPVFAYATERTLDAYKYQLLQTKQTFLNQVKSGEVTERVIKEGDGDSESGVGYAELVAMLSGNQDILQKSRLEEKLSRFKRAKRNFEGELYEAIEQKRRIEERIPEIGENISKSEQNVKSVTGKAQFDEYGKLVINSFNGEAFKPKKEKNKEIPAERTDYAKAAIDHIEKRMKKMQFGEIDRLNIGGYDLEFYAVPAAETGLFSTEKKANASIVTPNGVKYAINVSTIPGVFLNNIQKAVTDQIPNALRSQKNLLQREKSALTSYNEIIERGDAWSKQVEMDAIAKELKEVTDRLNTELKEKNDDTEKQVLFRSDQSAQAEMQTIKEKAQSDGSFMKAPNGKPSNLNERQWLQVRTKAFKKWFGDWEKAARIEKLRKSKPVEITGNEVAYSDDLNQYKKNALEYGKLLRDEYTNKDTGEKISLTGGNSRGGIREILQHDYKDKEHLQSIAALPQIIENSIFIDELENENRDKYTGVKSFSYYVCGLKIGEVDYTVKAVVANQSNGKRYYDHKLSSIEKSELLSIIPTMQKAGIEGNPLLSHIKDKRLLSILQTNSSKLTDENGEPLDEWINSGSNQIKPQTDNTGEFSAGNPDIRFRDKAYSSRDAFAQREWNRAKNALKEITDRLGVDVEVLETTDGLAGKKATAKGWYDPKTGKITIVMPNHSNSWDVQATLLHEAVGHHGLRKLFGEHFDTFLDNVFDNAEKGIQWAILDIANKENVSRRTATEEYLSSLAEDRNLLNGEGAESFLGKIKNFFLDMLAKIGFNIHFQLSDNELRYILWRSFKNLSEPGRYRSPIAHMQDVALQSKLKVGNFAEVEPSATVVAENETASRSKMKDAEKRFDNAKTEEEKREAVKDLVNYLNDIFSSDAETVIVRDNNELADIIERVGGIDYSDRIRKQVVQMMGLYNSDGIIYFNSAGMKSSEDILDTWIHENMHHFIFNHQDYLIPLLGKIDESIFSKVLPEEYLGFSEASKINELLSFLAGNIVLGKAIPQNDIIQKEVKPIIEKYLNQITNGRFSKSDSRVRGRGRADEVSHVSEQGGVQQGVGGVEERNTTDQSSANDRNNGTGSEGVPGDRGNEAEGAKGFGEIHGEHHANLRTGIAPGTEERIKLRKKADTLMDNADDLRKVVNYPKFLTDVLNGPAKEKLLAQAKEKGYTNLNKVIEKYLSEVEDTAELKRIKELLGAEMPDNALRYLLWRNANPNDGTPMWKAKDAVKTHSLDDNILFRAGEVNDNAIEEYEKRIRSRHSEGFKTLMTGIEEGWFDRMNSLKILQDVITQNEDVPDRMNAYLLENQLSSKNTSETKIFNRLFINPMIEAAAKIFGRDIATLDNYLNAKHGLERNRYMARQQADSGKEKMLAKLREKEEKMELTAEQYQKEKQRIEESAEEKYEYLLKKKDYSGLTALASERGQGETFTEAAEAIVKEVEENYPQEDINTLWDAVNKANAWMLKKQYDNGMMTNEIYEKISSMYQYYVPLRGFAETTAEEVYEYLEHETSDFNKVVLKAYGRTSKAESPFANMISMGESGIMQANRNLMKQAFYRFVATNPSNLATINDVWYVESGNEWIEKFPEIPENADGNEAADIIRDFNEEMAILEEQGKAVRGKHKLNLGMRIGKGQASEHAVKVWIGGDEKVIYINGNPRAAQAINGLTNSSLREKSGLMRQVEFWGRQMAANFTSRNPAFMATNFMRDIQFALVSASIKEGGKYSFRLAANAVKVPKTIAMNVFGNGGGQFDQYWQEFTLNGGETGYASLTSIDHHRKYVNKKLREFSGQRDLLSPFRAYVSFMENSNRLVEDISRFATYVTSRQNGRSIERSISDAKEITINFNRKGSGRYGAWITHSFYLFSNPALQGLRMLGMMSKNHPYRFWGAMSATFAMGYFAPVLNEVLLGLFGDDDDKEKYWNLSDWTRRNNLVLYAPWTKDKFITITLSHELRPFYGMGEIVHSLVKGKMTPRNPMMEIAQQFTTILPVDPLSGKDWWMPSALIPVWEAYKSNTNFMGSPVYKDTPWNKLDPEWTKSYKSTPKLLIEGAKWLNEVSGGDDIVKGGIDINPARMAHLFRGYMGGFLTTYTDLANVSFNLITGNGISVNDIPVANRLVRTSDDRTEITRINQEYYYYLDWLNDYEHRQRGYKGKIMNDKEYIKKYIDIISSGERGTYIRAKQRVNHINKLRENNPEAVEAAKKKFVEEMREINK